MGNRNLCFYGLLPVLMTILPWGEAIVGAGRDLLLTPRQGHQLNGKRIFYEEEKEAEMELLQRRSPAEQRQRPWERTLKHVTYVTLFTDAAANAAAGNLSQLHEYHDFLQTPYVPADPQGGAAAGSVSSRFGDIVTLAKGYLEQLEGPGNVTYRFLEGGTCFQLKCPASAFPQPGPNQRRRALWQVQRIRHRDGDSGGRPFHYEMKFSVTPLGNQAWQPHQPMSYIQKESDYPGSFGRFTREPGFAQRRQDRERYATIPPAGSAGNAEHSQATFVHGIFQPAPPLPPALLPKLNIGEYLKGSPKIELFPGFFGLGQRPNFVAPTTFRPNYPKLSPELEVERVPVGLKNEFAGNGGDTTAGAVTHHFHHHFYVAPGTGDTELAYRLPPPSSDPTPTSHPASGFYPPHKTVHFPSSHSGSSESVEEQEEHEREQDVLLRRPQIYGQASKYQSTSKLPPLLIYAGADEDKSFVQSEPLEETVYRYSEPDPLYGHHDPINVPLEKQQEEQPGTEQEGTGERPGSSLEQLEMVTTVAPAATTLPVLLEAAEASSSSSTTTTTTPTPKVISTTSSSSFVSTSTYFSPLRSISRYRSTPRITAGRSTTTTTSTTTEPPISKWAKRRKEQDSKGKSSLRHEAFIAASSASTTTTQAATPPPRPVVEVLTQKSVSRSVSIKVGENGEEIPILVDDEENEVKPVAIK